jgi:hypothetical protein
MSLGTAGNAGKITMAAGTYIIRASAPGYLVDAHMLRLARYSSGDVLQTTAYGTSAMSPVAAAMNTVVLITTQMTFAAGDYVKLEHYTTSAELVDGLGFPASIATIPESYAVIEFRKIG